MEYNKKCKNCNKSYVCYKITGEMCSPICRMHYRNRNHLCIDCKIPLKSLKSKRCLKCLTLKHTADGSVLWKGEDVGYGILHRWIRLRLKKPNVCPSCNEPKPLEVANISQEYKRDLSDWEWLCRRCHMVKDGRLAKLNNKNYE